MLAEESESAETRQINEFEALQAIYNEKLVDLRKKGAWNNWVPLNVSITLTPQQGSVGTTEIYVQVDLHIICDEKYPNSVPKVVLENGKGLSHTLLFELKERLEETAKSLKGEEMIFQLSQLVEEFLHEHNKPASKSFYEEMLERKREQKMRELQAKEMESHRQKQFMMEEVQKRQEMLMSEAKKWKETRRNSDIDTENDERRSSGTSRKALNSSTETSGESLCQHTSTININFDKRDVRRGRCIRHSTSNHVTYSGIDVETGDLMIICEWNFPIKNKNDLSRQLGSIEQEINYLMKLKHSNLSQYYGFKYEFTDDTATVYLLKEFTFGTNCFALFINRNLRIDVDYLKYVAREILIALDFLHRNNVVHKDVKDACVYVNESGVQITNYSIHRRLLDLNNQIQHNNYSKKTDIYKFGTLVLSLLFGKRIGENLDIPDTFSSDIYDFLTRCLAKNETDRFTAIQLLNHPFFNAPLVNVSPKRKQEKIELERNTSPEIIPTELQILLPNGQTRINNEFEFLQHLGKGAYGDVIKVKNKLDGGYYAIKRIKLNPKNRALNKKIVREVKLLSRLNHENVVRYFNSWIETTTIKDDFDVLSSATLSTDSTEERIPKVMRKEEFTINDNIEALAPSLKNVEVSIIYDSKSQVQYISSSDDESSDDDEAWGPNYEDSESESIEFERDSNRGEENCDSISVTSPQKQSDSPDGAAEIPKKIDFMYIQMEFCEKSTLRTAIDGNLYLEEGRMWRLFREIVEGLAYIHQQGMIHRDLKPVNIFLDSEDHVKIGDFGLATTSIKSKHTEYTIYRSMLESDKEETVDESKTGLVGTALYVAPEISESSKVVYTQKVDIYSLGIILLEMCYRPLNTSMERIKILTKLRTKEIIFPADFLEKNNEKKTSLIRWLLEHDVSKRPTSQELLESEHIPPPVLEERSLRELVRHTLNNPQLKGYKYLIASCFKQSLTSVQDLTYDKDPSASNLAKPLLLREYVKEVCVKIFKQHGGQNLTTPLLMPKSKFNENLDSCVKLMTNFGGVVTLPHDLRVPFARYVAWNSITNLRRYSIERVYREKKVFGFHPRELYECAFDIVSSTPGLLMSDAEILYIVYEILNELPGIKNKNVVIRLNHNLLLRAILLHCGIKDGHQDIYNLVWEFKEGKISKNDFLVHFIGLELSNATMNVLINYFNSEWEISKVANYLQNITKKKTGEAGECARKALQELKEISQFAVAFGVKYEMMVCPGLVYNIRQYSGMIFQFACEIQKKHKHRSTEVLAAGGRYDYMISWYRSIMEQATVSSKSVQQAAVGVSISLDKLVQALQNERTHDDTPDLTNLDVLVCSAGTKHMINESVKILKSLWTAGIKSAFIENINLNEIREKAEDLHVVHIVLLKDGEQGMVKLRSWEKDRFQEKSFSTGELVEHLQRVIKIRNDSNTESGLMNNLSRSESRSSYGGERHMQEVDVDVLLVDKKASNARKRCENQIRSQLSNLFKKLTGFVLVVGLSVDSDVIRTLASYLDFETEQQFHRSVEDVIERHPRHKEYLNDICDEIYEQKTKRKNPTVVLYSLSDNFHKVIF